MPSQTQRIPKTCAARILSRTVQVKISEDEVTSDNQEDNDDQVDNDDQDDEENHDKGQENEEKGMLVGDKEEIEVRAEEENNELCMVCGLGENEDDEEGELCVECTRCCN